jgi:hypothetical protein
LEQIVFVELLEHAALQLNELKFWETIDYKNYNRVQCNRKAIKVVNRNAYMNFNYRCNQF